MQNSEQKNINPKSLNLLGTKGFSSHGIPGLKLVSNKPKQNLVLSSRCKKKSPNIQPNISLENYFQHNDNSKDTKKSLNNLFRTYNYTKNEVETKRQNSKIIDPHKKKASSPAILKSYLNNKIFSGSNSSQLMNSKVNFSSRKKNYDLVENAKNKRSISSYSQRGLSASKQNLNSNQQMHMTSKQSSWEAFSRNWSKRITQGACFKDREDRNANLSAKSKSKSTVKSKTPGSDKRSSGSANYKDQLLKLLQTGGINRDTNIVRQHNKTSYQNNKTKKSKSQEDKKFSKNSQVTQKLKGQSLNRSKNNCLKCRTKSESSRLKPLSNIKKNSPTNNQKIKTSDHLKNDKFNLNPDKKVSILNSYVSQIKPDFSSSTNKNVLKTTNSANNKSTKNSASSEKNITNKYTQSNTNKNRKKAVIPIKDNLSTKERDLVLKYESIYYMGKLEFAYKSYATDHYSSAFRQHFKQTLQTIAILSKFGQPSEEAIAEKMIVLPEMETFKKTIILDLDETLIHCNENQNDDYDVKVPVNFPTGEFIEAGINIRPYAKELLLELSKEFEVIVFTASHSCYANPVIDFLDPEARYISRRLFRDNCVQIAEGFYVKDLRILKNRNLKDVLLVDNAAYSYALQQENGVPIIPFYQRKDDSELLDQLSFLQKIKDIDDVRPYIREIFCYDEMINHSGSLTTLFKEIFDM